MHVGRISGHRDIMPRHSLAWSFYRAHTFPEDKVPDALSGRKKWLEFCHEQAQGGLGLNRYKVVKPGITAYKSSAQAYIHCCECTPNCDHKFRIMLAKRPPVHDIPHVRAEAMELSGTETETQHPWRMVVEHVGCCGDKNRVVRGQTVVQRKVSRAYANRKPTQAMTLHVLDGGNGMNAPAYGTLQGDRKRWMARSSLVNIGIRGNGKLVNDWLYWLEDEHRQSCRIFNVDRPINMTEWIGYCFKSECLRLSRVFDSCARRGHSRSRGTVYRTVELRGHDMFAIIVVCTF